jgi:hypothetical protein
MEEFPDYEPFIFELANGNTIAVMASYFWDRLSESEWHDRVIPTRYYCVRTYCNEDKLPRHMRFFAEFRHDIDFDAAVLPRVWEWLTVLTASRAHLAYDSFDDFLTDFAETLSRETAAGPEAVEHFADPPAIEAPEDFDPEDDSQFNDQND